MAKGAGQEMRGRVRRKLTFKVLTCVMADDGDIGQSQYTGREVIWAFVSWSAHLLKTEKRAGG